VCGLLGRFPWDWSVRPEAHHKTDNAPRNKIVIIEVLTDAYTNRDFAKLEKSFAPDYIQQNPFIPAGRDGLRGYIEKLPPERRSEAEIALAQGDIVRVHGRYSGGDRKTLIARACAIGMGTFRGFRFAGT